MTSVQNERNSAPKSTVDEIETLTLEKTKEEIKEVINSRTKFDNLNKNKYVPISCTSTTIFFGSHKMNFKVFTLKLFKFIKGISWRGVLVPLSFIIQAIVESILAWIRYYKKGYNKNNPNKNYKLFSQDLKGIWISNGLGCIFSAIIMLVLCCFVPLLVTMIVSTIVGLITKFFIEYFYKNKTRYGTWTKPKEYENFVKELEKKEDEKDEKISFCSELFELIEIIENFKVSRLIVLSELENETINDCVINLYKSINNDIIDEQRRFLERQNIYLQGQILKRYVSQIQNNQQQLEVKNEIINVLKNRQNGKNNCLIM